jgi:alcohol dehydrogenase (cytochrome c)
MKTTDAILLGLCLAASPASAQVTADRLVDAAREPQQWMMYSGAYDGSRFSPLDQINRTNVQRLSLQWVFQTGVRGRH